jgi:glyoxylase-like metal-dependent hydrolase (beta-lactamase superfamily II)
MKLFPIHAGNFKLDGGAMFGVVPKSIWNPLNPADENNMCSWAMRCLLIQDGESLILIDNGMGNKQSEKFFGYYYLHGNENLDSSLAAAGFHKSEITDVILTHLHFDHCGGSVEYDERKEFFRTAFPNATYWSNEAHWNWALNPNPREKASFLKENILPIQDSGQLKFHQHGERLFPFLEMEYVSGHTESMMLPVIYYKGYKIIYMADLLPSTAHIPIPYVMAYDTRPLMTMEEKALLLEKCVRDGYILFFEHDKQNECCTLKQTEKGIRPDRIFSLSELG